MHLYCNYLHYLSALTVALLATMGTLLCCQGDPTSFLLCVYQNVEPRSVLCACSKYASQNSVHFDSTATNEDAMVLHQCRKLYCVHLGVLHFQERSKIALRAGRPWSDRSYISEKYCILLTPNLLISSLCFAIVNYVSF